MPWLVSGVGGVVSLLWFKRKMPDYACKFLEMVLILTAGDNNTLYIYIYIY